MKLLLASVSGRNCVLSIKEVNEVVMVWTNICCVMILETMKEESIELVVGSLRYDGKSWKSVREIPSFWIKIGEWSAIALEVV